MPWQTGKTQIATALAVAGTELFSSAVVLNPGELAHVQIQADFPVTPTDFLNVNVYTTLDDTAEVWDATPITSFQIDKATDPNTISMVISGVYKFRLGFKRSGVTDIITVDAWAKKDGVVL